MWLKDKIHECVVFVGVVTRGEWVAHPWKVWEILEGENGKEGKEETDERGKGKEREKIQKGNENV